MIHRPVPNWGTFTEMEKTEGGFHTPVGEVAAPKEAGKIWTDPFKIVPDIIKTFSGYFTKSVREVGIEWTVTPDEGVWAQPGSVRIFFRPMGKR